MSSRSSLSLLSSSLLVFAAVCSSCSSSTPTPGGGCSEYTPPASFDATKPTSFSKDVIVVFQKSCAFSTCHGATTGNANGAFLGNDPARVHAGLVNVKSPELPTMNFVTPGDPKQSYLMHKLDGSQCTLDKQCTNGSCQDSMPKNDTSLPVETRDIVRRWILQGAKND